jgi:hypothetical protein
MAKLYVEQPDLFARITVALRVPEDLAIAKAAPAGSVQAIQSTRKGDDIAPTPAAAAVS